jgi:hypothetical protein
MGRGQSVCTKSVRMSSFKRRRRTCSYWSRERPIFRARALQCAALQESVFGRVSDYPSVSFIRVLYPIPRASIVPCEARLIEDEGVSRRTKMTGRFGSEAAERTREGVSQTGRCRGCSPGEKLLRDKGFSAKWGSPVWGRVWGYPRGSFPGRIVCEERSKAVP